jgi:hypothetical protein
MVISTQILAGRPSKPIARQLGGHHRVAQYFLSRLTPGAVLRVFYRITVVGQYVDPPESGQAFLVLCQEWHISSAVANLAISTP